MSYRNSKLLVSDSIESIEKIKPCTVGFSFDEFIKSEIIVDAVVTNFTIIGRATARLQKILNLVIK